MGSGIGKEEVGGEGGGGDGSGVWIGTCMFWGGGCGIVASD